MKLQIIFATGNKDKIREIREIITDPEIDVVSMKEAGVACDPEEDGTSFEENSAIKARAVADLLLAKPERVNYAALRYRIPTMPDLSGKTVPGDAADAAARGGADADAAEKPCAPVAVMSDDSGLVIDALDGAPGIYSARYMGHETSYTLKMRHILELLKDVPDEDRSARFVAAVSAVVITKKLLSENKPPVLLTVRGAMEGRIAQDIKGENGFGYDPFFLLVQLGKTSAEISDEEKNALSHRGKALRLMLEELRNLPGLTNENSDCQ